MSQGAKFQPSENYIIEKDGKEILIISLSLDRKTFEMIDFGHISAKLETYKWKVNPLVGGSNAHKL